MAGATWNCSRLSTSPVYTIQPCSMSLVQSHIRNGVCVFNSNLPPALLAEWPGSFMCYCGNTGVERIPDWVSTESWPLRRKFSHHSSRDSNPRPFNHESGALTTELSPPLSSSFYLPSSSVTKSDQNLCFGQDHAHSSGKDSVTLAHVLQHRITVHFLCSIWE